MTKQAVPPPGRCRACRTSVITGAVLLLSLSVSPGARADEGDGLLGGVTGVVGGVTDPVVEPVVEVVQSAVPEPVQQPVQQAVAPVVEQVEQTVAPVPGADRATQPAVKAVESVVRPAEKPREDRGGGSDDPAAGSEPTPAPSSDPGDGPVRSGDAPGSGDGGGQDAPTSDGTRHGQGPAGWEPCDGLTDLPPRGMTTPAVGPEPGTSAASGSSWDVVDALLARSSAADRSGASDAREPAGRLTDVPWFDARGAFDGPGRSGTVPLLSGLLGLVGLLLVGVALVRSKRHA